MKCNRPLLDLAKGDPRRKPFELSNEGWVEQTSAGGFKVFCTTNHALAREAGLKLAPELLKMPLRPTGVTAGILDLESESEAMTIALIWFAIDPDDPERLEGGWACFLARGSRELKTRMRYWIESYVRGKLARSTQDQYLPDA